MLGITSTNSSFNIGYCFLQSETFKDYFWVLAGLKYLIGSEYSPISIATDRDIALMKSVLTVFPESTLLLCSWHIEKGINIKLKQLYKNDEEFGLVDGFWQSYVNSETEEEIIENWNLLKDSEYTKKEFINYLEETWIPYSKSFVKVSLFPYIQLLLYLVLYQ
jgi:hypothetical protein